MPSSRTWVRLLLRAGLAFSFIYPAIAGFFDPLSWIGFFPESIRQAWPWGDELLLHTFGTVELALALWLLIGRRVTVPVTAASLVLFGIVVTNLAVFDVVFRDISLLAMALALLFFEKEKGESELASL